MRTEEILLLKALKVKELYTKGHSGDFDPVELLSVAEPELAKKMTRNICAFISHELFNEIEELGQLLSITKRQIIEMALIDFRQKANKIIGEVDPFPAETSSQLEG